MEEKPVASTGLKFADLSRYLEVVAYGKDNPHNLRGVGQRILFTEDLGRKWTGEIITLRIETCGARRVRFFITSGVELTQTEQYPCANHEAGLEIARNCAYTWIRNTPEFSELRPVRDERERVGVHA